MISSERIHQQFSKLANNDKSSGSISKSQRKNQRKTAKIFAEASRIQRKQQRIAKLFFFNVKNDVIYINGTGKMENQRTRDQRTNLKKYWTSGQWTW